MTVRNTFPIAPHTYFRAQNKELQKELFLNGEIEQPQFVYNEFFVPDTLNQRLKVIQEETGDGDAMRSLELVRESSYLQNDVRYFKAFRRANERLYGVPRRDFAEAILEQFSSRVTPDTKILWTEVKSRLGVDSGDDYLSSVRPPEDIFQMYKKYFESYAKLLPAPGSNVVSALTTQLKTAGLSADGWRIRVLDGSDHAHTYSGSKTISIGKKYAPRTEFAVQRIVAHEVYGHAVRGPHFTLADKEGFAIVLEQLTKPRFQFRRRYRYLAVALGWGVIGAPMTFRDVYEVLWRLMVIGGSYTEKAARQYAFDECYRAFRGGRPDIAGAVFLKDTVYFDANIRVWNTLIHKHFSYNEFTDIIEGRRALI